MSARIETKKGSPWLQNLLKEAGEKGHSIANLAKHLGCSRQVIMSWRDGETFPNSENFIALLEYMGGDITRALPDYQPEAAAPPAQLAPVIGQVAAGTARYLETENLPPVPAAALDLRASRWYTHTRPCPSGRTAEYIRIEGDSMEPEYPHGSHVLCRPPSDPRNLPNGIHAIIRGSQSGDMTFKILQFSPLPGSRTAARYQIAAVPFNRRHEIQFFDSSEITIDWIALAMIHTRVNSAAPETAAPRGYKPGPVLRDTADDTPASLAAEPAPSWRTTPDER